MDLIPGNLLIYLVLNEKQINLRLLKDVIAVLLMEDLRKTKKPGCKINKLMVRQVKRLLLVPKCLIFQNVAGETLL